ncbi:MAG: EAL domain-containing protein, partial [Frisingicoccus sp.]
FFIFEMACRQLEEWKQEGKNLFLSCNFTRMTIAQEDFAEELEKIAGRYEFDYSNLVIEITEDVMEKNKEMAFDNISRCKALGFKIALDDIGSGYTSFSDLRDYPIDIVKIDRSILNSAVTEQGIALLGGLIILVHSLK